jgi:hypothetical protein
MQQPVPIVPLVQPLLFEFPQAMGLFLDTLGTLNEVEASNGAPFKRWNRQRSRQNRLAG